MKYLYETPRSVAPGKVVVHNHIRPARHPGARGFRAWEQAPTSNLEECYCGWAPRLPRHYRVAAPLT
jgi:hypothetical protein